MHRPTWLYLQLSLTELKNILFSNSTHLANLDHIFSSLQMKNLNPESLRNLPPAPEHVTELDLNPGTSGRKACPLPYVWLPPCTAQPSCLGTCCCHCLGSLLPLAHLVNPCLSFKPHLLCGFPWPTQTFSSLMILHSINTAMLVYPSSKSIPLTPPTWHLPDCISNLHVSLSSLYCEFLGGRNCDLFIFEHSINVLK